MVVRDSGIDRGRLNALVPEMVLDELEVHAGIQQMGRNRMAQAVTSQVPWQPGTIAVAVEPRLDLSLPQRAMSSRKERSIRGIEIAAQVRPQRALRRRPQWVLAPSTALQALDDDPAAIEVDVASRQQLDLADPESVVVDEREEGDVPRIVDSREELTQLGLGEVPRQALAE